MKCSHCGLEGDDVDFRLDYVGGKGMESVGPLCQDRKACWARWDEAHGLKDTYALRFMEARDEKVAA